MMLVFFSLYAERGKMPMGFSIYILVFMMTVCLSLFITISYGTWIHTEGPLHWYIHNKTDKRVFVVSAIFGNRVNTKENNDIKL
jgi:hypothetical protein